MDPTLVTVFTATLESLCNQALTCDPGSQQTLRKLSGKVISIEASAPALAFFIVANTDGTLSLMSHHEGPVTTRIRGQLTNLLNMAFNPDSSSLSQHNIEVIGSTGLLIDLQAVLQNLDIDWEDALNQKIGDALGHPIASGLRQVGQFFNERSQTIKRLSAEYIEQELRLVPSKPELQDFYRQVDELRLASDRAEARLQQLQQKLPAALQPQPQSTSGQPSDQ